MYEDSNKLLPVKSSGNAPTIKSFHSLVGSLLWISRCTRPDISFAVHRATRRTHAPTLMDYKVAKRIARYLKGTRSLKLCLEHDDEKSMPLRIISYSDADFAADKDDRSEEYQRKCDLRKWHNCWMEL